jgi:type I restriction enzyme S subunit
MSQMQQLITEHLDIWTAADTGKKSGRGRASSNASSVYGIKKLRELIFELAMRGKLVPQDANDEPASELLRKIRAERLAKNIPTKDFDSLALENSLNFPNEWECVKLGDVALIERGGSPRPIQDFLTNEKDGLNWIKIGDTEQGGKYITGTTEKIRKEGLTKTRMVYPGDFLLTNSMSFGRPYITQIEGCIHDGWLRISPPSMLDKDFLYILLSSPIVVAQFKLAAAGAVVLNLNADKVREVTIPIPPLAEQHRIVTKVDELMALCDQLEAQHSNAADAHEQLVSHLLGTLTQSQDAADFNTNWQRIATHFETLFTTESSIDTLKQTLLQLAVMGKLVPQDPKDEPAIELLKRIQAEKAKLVAEGKIKKDKPFNSIADSQIPFKLPSEWNWVRIADILAIKHGMAFKSNYFSEEPTPFVLTTPGNFYETGGFRDRQEKTKYYDGNVDQEYVLHAGDLIIPMTEQAPGLLGSAAFIPNDGKTYIHNQRLGKLTTYSDSISSKYIYWFFNCFYLRNELAKSCSGTTVRHTSPDRILCVPIPIPSFNEQQRIVAKVDELMALCEQLKVRITDARQQQQKLTNALIEHALIS